MARLKNKLPKPGDVDYKAKTGEDEEVTPNGKEIALILEDDMTVSPHAYRWLKAVHGKYGRRKDFGGVTLYSNSVTAHNSRRGMSGTTQFEIQLQLRQFLTHSLEI